jgi:hypothetical protein
MNWTFVFACQRFPTQISNEFFHIRLQVLYINIVEFLNFIFNTFMYVSLSIEIDSMNVVNGYCLKVHFIKLIKFLLLIWIKHVFSKGDKFPNCIGSKIYISSIKGPWVAYPLSLSLSLTHTHTHTLTHSSLFYRQKKTKKTGKKKKTHY